MTERCSLSSGSAPGFRYGGEIPGFCVITCEQLWDSSCRETNGEYEEYPHLIETSDEDCKHPTIQHSHDALQAVKVASGLRLYTLVDECQECGTEIGETVFEFQCPRP